MKRFLVIMLGLMLLVGTAGTGYSFSVADHVKIAPNGQGDLLIYPLYAAMEGGYKTKLYMVNSDPVNSVVVRFAMYSFDESVEVRDFMILLSPNDVWDGLVYFNTSKNNLENKPKAFVRSTDESTVLTDAPTFASEATPFNYELDPFNDAKVTAPYQEEQVGYIMAIMVAYGNCGAPPVDKKVIFAEYKNLRAGALSKLVLGGINTVSGHLEFIRQTADDFGGNTVRRAHLPATALRDYNNTQALWVDVAVVPGRDGLQITNIPELQAVLAKDNFVMPYWINDTDSVIHAVLFPIKDRTNPDSVYFQENALTAATHDCVPYDVTAYDMKEGKEGVQVGEVVSPQKKDPGNQFCGELNWINTHDLKLDAAFKKGWIRYTFNDVTGTANPRSINRFGERLKFTGAPTIPFVLTLSEDGGYSLMYAAYDEGVVSYISAAGVEYKLNYYQYFDYANTYGGVAPRPVGNLDFPRSPYPLP